MFRHAFLLATLSLALGTGVINAAPNKPCKAEPAKTCEIRKHPNCGPISLRYWQDEDGHSHCDSATVHLTATDIIPEVRRLRCNLYGEPSDIHFSAENYRTVTGPRNGDIIRMEDGQIQITVHGQYNSYTRETVLTFKNQGPGRNVLLKCQGFGPA